MKKGKAVLALILTIALLCGLGFIAFVGIGENKDGSLSSVDLGLDLSGGVSITYGIVNENPTSEQIEDTVEKIRRRVEVYSTEAVVYPSGSLGDSRITVEIPGVSDADAILAELGQPGNLYFIREKDAWLGQNHSKYSYKDFNKNESFLSYTNNESRFQLYSNNKVISEAKFIVSTSELEKLNLQFGWITSNNTYWDEKHIGGMTFLVASIIYIMLNDKELMNRDIEVSLEMQNDAKRLLEEKNIDVYYRIFRTPKMNYDHKENHRRYIFETINRNDDIDYFEKILILKENSIINTINAINK